MPRVTLIFALLLIGLGIVGFAGDSGSNRYQDSSKASAYSTTAGQTAPPPKRSVTALIPAFTGGLLLICGLLALNEKWRKHAMHSAALVGSLGLLAAGGRAATGLVTLFSDDGDVNQRSLFFVSLMAILCGAFVAFSLMSFVQARRRKSEVELQPAIR